MRPVIEGAINAEHGRRLAVLAEFFQAERLVYVDYGKYGKSESYMVYRGGKCLSLRVSGNQYDGGYATWDVTG